MNSVGSKAYLPTPAHRVAFIGLGVMGYPMAGHLARAGHQVTVFNRNSDKSSAWKQEFTDASPSAAESPRAAASGADMVFCCVGNDDDVCSVVLGEHGALAGMAPGATLIDHSTKSAQLARDLFDTAGAQSVAFIDAPVSGGQTGAKNALLTVMCGGSIDAFNRVRPVIMAYARAVTRMGESGTGQLTKMINQVCIAGILQGLAEAVAFGKHARLNMDQVLKVISQGAAQSWQMENRGETMVAGEFDFGFAVDWMRKDLGLVLDEARRNGARLPLTALVDQFYADVQQMGGQRRDTSALIQRLNPIP